MLSELISASAAALAVGILSVVYFTWRIIYLLYFHPLAKFPGPFWAKVTSVYGSYYAWKGDTHLDMMRVHEKYGDFVRYTPDTLFVNNADGLHDIHSSGAYSSFLKSGHYQVMEHRVPSTFTARGGKDHLRRRRIVSQTVSEKAQRGYDPRIAYHVRKFCDAVFPAEPGVEGQPKNMADWCAYLSFDLITDLVFSASYNLLGSEKFRYVPHVIDKSNVRMSVLVYVPFVSWLRALDNYLFGEALVARNRLLRFVSRAVRERTDRALGKWSPKSLDPCPPRADIFAALATAKDPVTNEGFSADDMVSESITLMVAGSDTSSTAIASTLFYLADNPHAYHKAAAEVRRAFHDKGITKDRAADGPELGSCVYLRACIDEALRMSPPNGGALTREVIAKEGVTIAGNYIPSGCNVGVPLYAIHHDSRYYPEPFHYRPERWLEDDGTGSIERARYAFNPFGIGMRGCLGKGLAYHEVMTAVATVLYLGDFRFADGELGQVGRGGAGGTSYGRHRRNEYQLRDHITGQKQGPWLCFTRRELA
ncbi:cytochrome P450 [Echria macrotheca]|uniref:Cytochrome P450 n=1 Tax=Echria macrotheca TaxID=438768 RepID=A0AAJ0BA17_9PEZI|nr:cytochrome P450 [Echria macrotheca]